MMRLIKLMVVCLLALGLMTQALAVGKYSAEELDELIGGYSAVYARPPAPKYSYDITAHSNCILENSRNVQQTPLQANRVSEACRHKATPKKCRDVSAMPPDNNSKSPQEICVDECRSAGMWSRKYGDCSLD